MIGQQIRPAFTQYFTLLVIICNALAPFSCDSFSPPPWGSRTHESALRIRRVGNNLIIEADLPRRKTLSALALMKVTVRIVGRARSEKWIEDAVSIYQKRLRTANIDIDTEWHKSNDALVKGVASDCQKNHAVVLLDPKGKECTSEQFSTKFYDWMEEGGSRVVFVVGGAEGLPDELRYPDPSTAILKRPNLLSLSKMTFTHQFARLLLIEQVYRASEIRKGTDYHK